MTNLICPHCSLDNEYQRDYCERCKYPIHIIRPKQKQQFRQLFAEKPVHFITFFFGLIYGLVVLGALIAFMLPGTSEKDVESFSRFSSENLKRRVFAAGLQESFAGSDQVRIYTEGADDTTLVIIFTPRIDETPGTFHTSASEYFNQSEIKNRLNKMRFRKVTISDGETEKDYKVY